MERHEIEHLLFKAADFAGFVLARTGNPLDAERSTELKMRAIEVRTLFEKKLKAFRALKKAHEKAWKEVEQERREKARGIMARLYRDDPNRFNDGGTINSTLLGEATSLELGLAEWLNYDDSWIWEMTAELAAKPHHFQGTSDGTK